MLSQSIKKIINKLPDSPGVYIFRDKKKKILYIGKATSLRDRVKSYFSRMILETRGPVVEKMVGKANSVGHIKTDSVLEALILEAHLIKKYQPEANTAEKDNKSFNFVVITKEDFPRVLTIRGHELNKLDINPRTKTNDTNKATWTSNVQVAESFGPFPNGGQLKEALKLVRKIFPFRDKCEPAKLSQTESLVDNLSIPRSTLRGKANSGITPQDTDFLAQTESLVKNRSCFNRQIGLCPGVCSGEISKEEYAKQIKNIVLFFEGKKKELLKNLEKQMKTFSRSQEYENANKVKRTIFALNHIQDVSLIKDEYKRQSGLDSKDTFRIESYDIAHMAGENVVGVMTVVEEGEIKKSDYRKFKIRDNPGINDVKALKEIIERRLGHIEWKFPNLIVVDGGKVQKRAVEEVLRRNRQNIPVVSVVKDERHRPREILGDKKWYKCEREIILSNHEAHRFAIKYHKKLRGKIE